MKFLIVAAVIACASAAPSGLVGYGYSAPLIAHGAQLYAHAPQVYAHAAPVVAAPLAPALPTISSGDLQAAAIDAHVDASDHARAAVDAAREQHDQAAEIHGQAINNAEEHSWQAVDAVKTAEAQLDGAAAGAAPHLAKSLVGHAAPIVHAAPYAAPYAHGPVAPLVHSAPLVAAPAYAHGGYSKSVVTQSLSQSHPAPHAPVVYAAAPLAHGPAYHAW